MWLLMVHVVVNGACGYVVTWLHGGGGGGGGGGADVIVLECRQPLLPLILQMLFILNVNRTTIKPRAKLRRCSNCLVE